MTTGDPNAASWRTGVVSLRTVRPKPWMANLYAAEDLLVSAGAELMVVEPVGGVVPGLGRSEGLVGRITDRAGVKPYRLDRVATVDHVVAFANDPADLHVLHGLREPIGSLGARRTLIQTECWPKDVEWSERLIRSVYEQFDDVFLTIESSVGLLAGLHPRVHPLLQFTDVTAHPATTRFDRPIDVINYGRRNDLQHRLLMDWADSEPDRWYSYDTMVGGTTPDPLAHRRSLGQLLSNSRVAVCNYAAFSVGTRVGQAREAGPRFFEAMAGGCIVVGDLPTSDVFTTACADLEGFVQWPLNDSGLPDAFHRFAADDEARRRVSAEHRRLAVEHHDLAHRLDEIHRRIGLPVPGAVTERIECLGRLG